MGVVTALPVRYAADWLYLPEQAVTTAIIGPNCLSSLHLDIEPGDREADCGGIMEPVGVWVRKNGEWAAHPSLQEMWPPKFKSCSGR